MLPIAGVQQFLNDVVDYVVVVHLLIFPCFCLEAKIMFSLFFARNKTLARSGMKEPDEVNGCWLQYARF